MDISILIKEARLRKGVTQQDLADKIYVTRQTISKWELGKSQLDYLSLELLSRELDIELISKEKLRSSHWLIFITLVGLLFPLALPLRYFVFRLNRLGNKRFVLLFKCIMVLLVGLYLKTLNDNVYGVFLVLVGVSTL
ncbi:helix-turn-helix transcriptional regulator [Streptococcus caballi]|uniref:helix-turn-helix transcriptional regulator n=1 Tax=Streptococcus caballi TaxID=439220 RepID=UPI00037D6DD6|nr:helix-turn-helix transcriptional regulator [Streptococcus caballi]